MNFFSPTAAHCIQNKDERDTKSARDIKLLFGAFNLDDNFEQGRYILSPSQIMVHKDWNPFVESFDGDLALLMTDDQIPVTRFIKPVCLWIYSGEPDAEEGFIAGWGLSENSKNRKREPLPKILNVPIIDQAECFLSNYRLVKISSKRTFCGGPKDGSGPCNGKTPNRI